MIYRHSFCWALWLLLALAPQASASCSSNETVTNFARTLRVDVLGLSQQWNAQAQSQLETTLQASYNSVSDCGLSVFPQFDSVSVLPDGPFHVIVEGDESVVDENQVVQYSLLVQVDVSCTGCDPTLPLFLKDMDELEEIMEDASSGAGRWLLAEQEESNNNSTEIDHNNSTTTLDDDDYLDDDDDMAAPATAPTMDGNNATDDALPDDDDMEEPSNTDAPTEELVCVCDLPTESQLLTELSNRINFVVGNQAAVQVILGLEEVEALEGCNPDEPATDFESSILVAYPSAIPPTDEELQAMEEAFFVAYTQATSEDVFCDPLVRRITSVTAEVEAGGGSSSRSSSKTMGGALRRSLQQAAPLLQIRLVVQGTCKGAGCDAASTFLFEYEEQQQQRRRRRALLEDCYCPSDLPRRGPMPDEVLPTFTSLAGIVNTTFVGELTSFECDAQVTEFTVNRVIELVPKAVLDPSLMTIDHPDFAAVALHYQRAFAQVAIGYCDPLQRQIVSVQVTHVVPDVTKVKVGLEITASCRGCDPQATDIFDVYTAPPSGERRLLLEKFDVMDSLPGQESSRNHVAKSSSTQRYLQDSATCYCPADPVVRGRGASEEDVIPVVSRLIQADATMTIIAASRDCAPLSNFEGYVVVEVLGDREELDGKASELSTAFKSIANQNVGRDDVCDPTSSEYQDVKSQTIGDDQINGDLVILTPTEEDDGGTSTVDGRRWLEDSTSSAEPSSSAIPTAAPSRSLTPTTSRQPTQTPSFSPSSNPTLTTEPSISSQPSNLPSAVASAVPSTSVLPSMNPSEEPSLSQAPTGSPSGSPTMFPTRIQFTNLLFSYTGECRGCAGGALFTNDASGRRALEEAIDKVLRKPKTTATTTTSNLEQRFLQDVIGTSDSCFCPIGIPTTSTSEEEFSRNFEEKTEAAGINVGVQQAFDARVCNPRTQRFESEILRIDFTAKTDAPNFGQILEVVKNSYNAFKGNFFCDPLFRRMTSLNLWRSFSDKFPSDGPCRSYVLEFEVNGRCIGCDDGDPMLGTRGNRELQNNNRANDDDDFQCWCKADVIGNRIPTFSEFASALARDFKESRRTRNVICEVQRVTDDILETDQPSDVPSASPSDSPSDAPSDAPSDEPSDEPSDSPSDNPSDTPTVSMLPSTSPSDKPSNIPSASPTSCIHPTACVDPSFRRTCRGSDGLCAWTNSCSGLDSCRDANTLQVGENACIGPAACNKASGAQIGDDSCVDNDDVGASCRNLVDGVVGTNSCLGTRACADTTSDSLIVADNSCQGTDACKDTGADKRRQETTVIGTGSCQGVKACEGFAGVSIGDNSCNCFECCACWSWQYPGAPFLPDEIPSNSCNTPGECCPLSSSPSDFPSSTPSSSPTPCGKKCLTASPTSLFPTGFASSAPPVP